MLIINYLFRIFKHLFKNKLSPDHSSRAHTSLASCETIRDFTIHIPRYSPCNAP